MKKILSLSLLLLSVLACGRKGTETVAELPKPAIPVLSIDTTLSGLVIYYPPTDSIELRCFDRPEPEKDSSIVFCCAAAFTTDFRTAPDHDRICSDHVSGGKHYLRPRIKRNTGAFAAWNGRWRFLYDKNSKVESFRPLFRNVASAGGAGFAQEMLIHNGSLVPTIRPYRNVNQFRALCEIDGRLCIVDAVESRQFGDFILALLAAGATEAIYTDMGPGWNYSWYREYADSGATYIHQTSIGSATNWLVFHHKP